MAFSPFEFTKNWENPEDFPTYEYNETQVRADIQLLFDELKNALNGLGAYVDSGDVPVSVDADDVAFTPTAHITSEDVQSAIEEVQAQISSYVMGTIPDHSLTNAKLSRKTDSGGAAVARDNIADDAINGDKIADDAVDNEHIADNAVHADQIKNGEVTNDKLAPGVLPNKADLDPNDNIVTRNQLLLRRPNRTVEGAATTYTLTPTDIGAYVVVDSWGDTGLTVQIPYDSTVKAGSYLFLECTETVRTVASGAGMSLFVPGTGTVSSYSVPPEGEVLLLVKVDPNLWALVPLYHKIRTVDLADGAVTYEKTSGVQKSAVTLPLVFIPGDAWGVFITGQNYWTTTIARTETNELDINRVLTKPAVILNADGTTNSYRTAENYNLVAGNQIYLAGITDTEFIFHAKSNPNGPQGAYVTIIGL